MKGRRTRKEGRGVAVLARAKEQEIENGHAATKKSSQVVLIYPRGLTGFFFPSYAVDVFTRQGNLGQECIIGEFVVALGMVLRNTAFVRPKEMHPRPGDGLAIRSSAEERVQSFRS
jgi:hypothetical protein